MPSALCSKRIGQRVVVVGGAVSTRPALVGEDYIRIDSKATDLEFGLSVGRGAPLALHRSLCFPASLTLSAKASATTSCMRSDARRLPGKSLKAVYRHHLCCGKHVLNHCYLLLGDASKSIHAILLPQAIVSLYITYSEYAFLFSFNDLNTSLHLSKREGAVCYSQYLGRFGVRRHTTPI